VAAAVITTLNVKGETAPQGHGEREWDPRNNCYGRCCNCSSNGNHVGVVAVPAFQFLHHLRHYCRVHAAHWKQLDLDGAPHS